MTLSTLYRSSFFIILLSLATTAHGSSADLSYFSSLLKDRVSQYLSSSPLLQNIYGTGSAGLYNTTELIKNNPKIAGTVALYAAWYMGQKRWAEDTINEAEKFLKSINNEGGLGETFKTWQTAQYPTIASIMSNKEVVAKHLIASYKLFDPKTFCTCPKIKGTEQEKKAIAIKLALKIENIHTKKMLDLFTENRTLSLTNIPYWIKEWIEENYKNLIIKGEKINLFDPYNIRSAYNRLIAEQENLIFTAKAALANFSQEKAEREKIILTNIAALTKGKAEGKEKEELSSEAMSLNSEENERLISQYKEDLSKAQERLNELRADYEQRLTQFIDQKIALTGLPITDFVSKRPAAYWNWSTAPLPTPEANQNSRYALINWMRGTSALLTSGLKRATHISSGFIWPYEQKASQLYWELFQYMQRIAALDSAISEYIKEHNLSDVSSSYNLNDPQQIINVIQRFSESSEACAEYCIKKLEALQVKK